MSRLAQLFSLLMVAAMPWPAVAQDASAAPPPTASVTVSGVISLQPAHEVLQTGSLHLNRGVGGAAPGVAIAVAAAHPRGATIDVEASTTWPISETQSYVGALASRFRAIEGKHSDTFVSFLAGYRHRLKAGEWLEYKAGGTMIFGRSSIDGEPVGSETAAARKFALTGGLDWVKWTKANRAIVVSAKYSYAFRGYDDYDPSGLYLGEHIVRAGVGIRWGLK